MRASVEVSAIHNRSIEPVTITRQDGRYLRLEPGEQIDGPFTYRYDDQDAEHVPSPNETWFVDSPLAEFVTATVHPSSILRAPSDEARRIETKRFIDDLKKIRKAIS